MILIKTGSIGQYQDRQHQDRQYQDRQYQERQYQEPRFLSYAPSQSEVPRLNHQTATERIPLQRHNFQLGHTSGGSIQCPQLIFIVFVVVIGLIQAVQGLLGFGGSGLRPQEPLRLEFPKELWVAIDREFDYGCVRVSGGTRVQGVRASLFEGV